MPAKRAKRERGEKKPTAKGGGKKILNYRQAQAKKTPKIRQSKSTETTVNKGVDKKRQ